MVYVCVCVCVRVCGNVWGSECGGMFARLSARTQRVEAFMTVRDAFVRSHAVLSACHYVLGYGIALVCVYMRT